MAYSDSEIQTILEEYPHGGGEYYDGKLDPSTADVSVSSASELQSATGPNNVVRVTGHINLTGWEIDLGNSTLVGNRGWNGASGPILYSTTEGKTSGGAASNRPYCMLYATGNDTPRVTGLRLRGSINSTSTRSWTGEHVLQRGIWLNGDGGEVDNCEIYGWRWCGVMVGGLWSSYGENHGVHVHHCHFHRTMQYGYGYGIDVARGSATIDHCYFNYNRHSIAGQGRWFNDYLAEECIFGPNHISHQADMHCLTESGHSDDPDPDDKDFGLRAGGAVEVRKSTFLGTSNAAATARGEPWDYFQINDCWLSHSSLPTNYNSGNSRDGAWYQQNVHGISAGGVSYPRLAANGDYTDAWSTSGNRTGANDESVGWELGTGAMVNLENPSDSPAYHGYGEGAEPEPTEPSYTLTVHADSAVTLTRDWEDASTTREPTDGEVVFSVIEGGYYLTAEGYAERHVEVTGDMSVELEKAAYDVTLTIIGDGGETLAHGEVTALGETETVGDNGTVTFYNLDPGDYPVSVSAIGWFDISTTVSVVDSDVSQTITLENNPDEWYLFTDADGRADLGAQAYDQTFSYDIDKDGYHGEAGTVLNDTDSDLLVHLSPEGWTDDQIDVTVTTRDDTPIANASVVLYSSDSSAGGSGGDGDGGGGGGGGGDTFEADVEAGEIVEVRSGDSSAVYSPYVIAGQLELAGELRVRDPQ